MIKFLTLILFIISFRYPIYCSWASIFFFILVELYLVITLKRCRFIFGDEIKFNKDETRIIKKYSLYFKYPYAARSFSTSLSLIGLSVVLWVPWLLFNGLWTQALIIGLNYFPAQFLSAKLNIRFYLHDSVERLGREEFREEMLLVDSVCDKLSATSS